MPFGVFKWHLLYVHEKCERLTAQLKPYRLRGKYGKEIEWIMNGLAALFALMQASVFIFTLNGWIFNLM